MKPVSQVIPGAETVETVLAKEQKEYIALPAFHTELTTITRWQLSEEEREHIIAGGDLFLAQLNFGGPNQPLLPLALHEDKVLPIVLACEDELLKRTNS